MKLLYFILCFQLVCFFGKPTNAHGETQDSKPNFIIIFTDDQGYGDLSCYDGDHVSTPRIDRMATEGARLTSFTWRLQFAHRQGRP